MPSRDEDWRQDAPFFGVAVLLHAVVLSGNPSLPWSSMKPPERTIPVEFVQLPLHSPLPELPVPGDGSTRAPGLGPGELQPERRGPAPKHTAAKAKSAAKKAVDPQAAAKRRLESRHKAMRLALARSELTRQKEVKAAAVREARALAAAAALEAARLKAEQRAAAAEAARAAAALKAREAAERRMARARKQADIARTLAFLPNPDERITDVPRAHAVGGGAGNGAEAEHGLSDSLGAAAPLGEEAPETPAYAQDAARRTGSDAYSAPASGGGYGQGGGDASFTLEGPVGSRRLVQRVLPESPEWLARRQLDLGVQIRFQVLADGSVKPGAVISRTSGFPELDRRALEAIKRWRFASLAGARPVWGMVSFRFTS